MSLSRTHIRRQSYDYLSLLVVVLNQAPSERFQFIVAHPNESKIIISVLSFRPLKEPVVLGDAILNIKDISATDAIKWIGLLCPATGTPAGEVELEMELLTIEQAVATREHIVYEFQRLVGKWGKTVSICMHVFVGMIDI
jgi:hypothetical protein